MSLEQAAWLASTRRSCIDPDLDMAFKPPATRSSRKRTSTLHHDQPSNLPSPSQAAKLTSSKPSSYSLASQEELSLIQACSATVRQSQQAFRTFQHSRSQDDLFKKNKKAYDPAEDRWLQRLTRYLKFYEGSKSVSGWPITPYKFKVWTTYDPRPTIRSLRTYLQTLEAARCATHHLFYNHFRDLSNLPLTCNDIVIKILKDFELSHPDLPGPPDPKLTSSPDPETRSQGAPSNPVSPSALTHHPSKPNPSKPRPSRAVGSSPALDSPFKPALKSKITGTDRKLRARKPSVRSDSSLESLGALWNLPALSQAKPKANSQVKKPKRPVDVFGVTSSYPLNQPSSSRVPQTDAYGFKCLDLFTDTRSVQVRDDCLKALQEFHPLKSSSEQVVEMMSELVKELTSEQGELHGFTSQEDLTSCLMIYLKYWECFQVSGLPIQALKICIWLDSFQDPVVSHKEAIDIATGFDRLNAKLHETTNAQAPLFESSFNSRIIESPIWISFLDHFGWLHPSQNQDPQSILCPSPPALQSPALETPLILPNHVHKPAKSKKKPERSGSISSIGSSLSSLPESASPPSNRFKTSMASECIPSAQDPSRIREKDDQPAVEQPLQIDNHVECEPSDGNLNSIEHHDVPHHQNYPIRFKRASSHSVEHQRFLTNLRRFIELF